jgi:aspartate aminotransferase
MTELSSLLNRFSEPETLKMAKLGRELRAKGIDVIDLSLGEPDFDTPQHIKDAAIKAINDNWSHYTPVSGFLDLREAVCTKLKRDNNLDYAPENIVTSTGAKQSLANAILALVDEGDEVIIPTPYWVTYSELVKIARGKVVEIRTSVENGFKPTVAQVEAAITPKSKVFMFSSPCNPSGAVYSKAELEALVAVFLKHPQITILSDEIYEYINFEGAHESIAQFADIKDRVVVINGLSKGDLRPSLEMTEEFTRRRTKTLELVKDIPGFKCFEPQGAFYVFPDVSYYYGKSNGTETISNAADFSMYLLNTAHVSSVMGDAFGEPNCVRFSFANSMPNIEKAWARIKEALAKLS